ncbi:MAG: type II toxin-antitoxin system HicA family toxin [Anaerolineae bacterium]
MGGSATATRTVIPNHPGDIPKGTLNAIVKQLGIGREEFDSAKD